MSNDYVFDYESICDFSFADDITIVYASIAVCYENGKPNGKYRYVYDIEIINPTTLQTVCHTRTENVYSLDTCNRLFKSLVEKYVKTESGD